MHVPFRIHYRNNLIDKKDSYPIPRPPSWGDRNCSYGHQLYPSESLNLGSGRVFCKRYLCNKIYIIYIHTHIIPTHHDQRIKTSCLCKLTTYIFYKVDNTPCYSVSSRPRQSGMKTTFRVASN